MHKNLIYLTIFVAVGTNATRSETPLIKNVSINFFLIITNEIKRWLLVSIYKCMLRLSEIDHREIVTFIIYTRLLIFSFINSILLAHFRHFNIKLIVIICNISFLKKKKNFL